MGAEEKALRAIPVTDKVWWVGVVDRELDDFHGYLTPRGSTYNAYLVVGDTVALIDTVKKPFFGQMMDRIASVIDPKRIDLIVSNHSEMDHTGALPETIAAVEPKRVVASQMGARAIAAHFGGLQIEVVKSGEAIRLGEGLTLRFVETRLLHWPDSMVTYLPEKKLLFSQDIMGMHVAVQKLFADENPEDVLVHEAAKYYANIIMPYSDLVLRALDSFSNFGIEPEIIAPDHGPIWRGDDVSKIIAWYRKWAEQAPTDKVVIAYDTMWGSTAKLAQAVAEGVRDAECTPVVHPLSNAHRSDIATELLESGAFVVGSPTINNNMFPTVADLLTYIKGLKPKNLVGATFGSFGWSGESVKQVAEALTAMKIEVVDTLRVQYVPEEKDLRAAYELGQKVAHAVKIRLSE